MRISLGQLGAQVCDESGCYDDGSSTGSGTVATIPANWDPYANAGVNPAYTGTQGQYSGKASPPSSSSSTNWGAVISSIFSPITKLANTRYGVPQLNPGQSITQGPGGTYQYTQNGVGVSASGASLTGTAGLSGSLPLLIGGAVLVALFMSGKR